MRPTAQKLARFCFRPVCLTTLVVGLFLMAAPVYSQGVSGSGRSPVCERLGACLTVTDPHPHPEFLVSAELLLYAALRQEQAACQALNAEYDSTQQALVFMARELLKARFASWKLDEEELRDALSNLMTDLAVLSRFYEPQKEFLLSFDKSVQVRFQTFERRIHSGRMENSEIFPWVEPLDGPAAKVRLYAALYPLDLATRAGRTQAMLWAHLLHSEPAFKALWRRMNRLAELRYGSASSDWERVLAAVQGLPLARLEDLSSPERRGRFALALEKTLESKEAAAVSSLAVSTRPLPLLPAPLASLRALLSPLSRAGEKLDGKTLQRLLSPGGNANGNNLENTHENLWNELRENLGLRARDAGPKGGLEALILDPGSALATRLSPSARLALFVQAVSPGPGTGSADDKNNSIIKVLQSQRIVAEMPVSGLRVELASELYRAVARVFATRAEALEKAGISGLNTTTAFRSLRELERLFLALAERTPPSPEGPHWAWFELDFSVLFGTEQATSRVLWSLSPSAKGVYARAVFGGANWILQAVSLVSATPDEAPLTALAPRLIYVQGEGFLTEKGWTRDWNLKLEPVFGLDRQSEPAVLRE